MNARTVALLAGFFFISLATFTQGLLPMLEPQSTTDAVTRVVRTELGELKWVKWNASDYTAGEAAGREIYIREGCMYCHSQYVRPVAGESRRWGPVSQAGEYAFDTPHLFSTRRIGPDLSRVGLKYSDEWHLAHFWDPRMLVPDSIMPRFARLFDVPPERVRIVEDAAGNRTLERTPVTERLFDFSRIDDPAHHARLTPNADGLLFVRHRGRYPVIWTPGNEFEGDRVQLAVMTEALENLIAYLQKLGTNRGKWRDTFGPQTVDFTQASLTRSEDAIAFGKEVYERRCASCHGTEGNGNGPAATFMYRDRPRDFTKAVFKFRSTPSDSLPTDADLLRTITRGVRGTSMPSWHMLSESKRLAVIQYIKYVLAVDRVIPEDPYVVFEEEEPAAPLHIARPPQADKDLLAQGRAIWQQAKCWECHGSSGAGDGEKAGGLEDDNRFAIVPADLTSGQFKSGASVKDVFRTITTGLSGTPMPSYGDSLSDDERWALSYYVVSLSAFTDPLYRRKLDLPEAVREALNDPSTQARTSATAYAPAPDAAVGGARYGGNAWAARRGMGVVSAPAQAPAQHETSDRRR